MSMADDLFRAILAMDAYNRGYNAGVSGLDNTGSIGAAELSLQKQDSTAQDASFFAQAYTWNGKTIIAYRGSDGTAPTWLPFGWAGAVPSTLPGEAGGPPAQVLIDSAASRAG